MSICGKESQNPLLYRTLHGASPSGMNTSGHPTVSNTSLACLKQRTFPFFFQSQSCWDCSSTKPCFDFHPTATTFPSKLCSLFQQSQFSECLSPGFFSWATARKLHRYPLGSKPWRSGQRTRPPPHVQAYTRLFVIITTFVCVLLCAADSVSGKSHLWFDCYSFAHRKERAGLTF